MSKNNKIVWLVSYPKSGNTWLRMLLSNALSESNQGIDINNIPIYLNSIAGGVVEDTLGIDINMLSDEEVDNLRPGAFNILAEQTKNTLYIKVHESYYLNKNLKPIFPKEPSFAVVYMVRNPLDIVVSYSNHSNNSFDETILNMSNTNHIMGGRLNKYGHINQLNQKISSWSNHVESWLNQKSIPVHLIKYEDLLEDTFEELKKLIEVLGLSFSDEKINQAIEFSSFENLQKQEEEQGFQEKFYFSKRFFNKGKVGTWKEVLSKEQVEKIINDHKKVMEKLGYSTNVL